MTRPTPNLVIPGAAKSGTTALYKQLTKHPNCHGPETHDIEFLQKRENLQHPDRYYDHFVLEDTAPDRDPKIVCDGTPNYLFVPEAPSRLKKLCSDELRLIFMLRSPARRALSHYWHRRKKFEDLRPLEQVFQFDTTDEQRVLEEETLRVEEAMRNHRIDTDRLRDVFDDVRIPFQHVRNSMYTRGLDRFAAHFPRRNMKIILSEQFRQHPVKIYRDLEAFLGIDRDFLPDNLEKQYNPTTVPRSGFPYNFINHVIKPIAGWLLPDSKPRFLLRLYHAFIFREKPEAPDPILNHLERIFDGEKTRLRRDWDLPVDEFW